MPDADQLVRPLIGQRLEQNPVHHAEDGRVDPDPDRESENGDGGEERSAGEASPCESELTQDFGHGAPSGKSGSPLPDAPVNSRVADSKAEREWQEVLAKVRASVGAAYGAVAGRDTAVAEAATR